MGASSGFIVYLDNPLDFYKIKSLLENMDGAKVIYCTLSANERLFIKKETELQGIS